MVLTDNAKNRIRDLLSADFSTSKMGTDATVPTASDTGLIAGTPATSAIPVQTSGNKIINSTYVLLSTVGNGITYKEFGTYINTSTLLNRVIFPDFAKTGSEELHVITVYRVE